MVLPGLLAGFAAIVLSGLLAGPADAYPTYATRGTTSVNGTYRPVDFTFSVVESDQSYINVWPDPSQPLADSPLLARLIQQTFGEDFAFVSVSLLLEGIGVQQGTGLTFDSGIWRMNLLLGGILQEDGETMVAYALDNLPTGTLDLVGRPSDPFPSSELGYDETPKLGDRFLIYGRQRCSPDNSLLCEVLTLDLGPNASGEEIRALLLDGSLTHVGPFVPCRGWSWNPGPYDCNRYAISTFGLAYNYLLDGGPAGRTSYINKVECLPGRDVCSDSSRGVSSAGVFASNVPEPGTLALLALGLAGLTLRRRAA